MVMDLLGDEALLNVGPPRPTDAATLCHICRERPGRMTCRACSQPACAAHLWTMFALCTACASDRDVARWHNRGEAEAQNWLEEAK